MGKYFNQVARPWMLHNAAEHGARPSPCLHQQALGQKPRCDFQKNSDIKQLMFFLLEKTHHMTIFKKWNGVMMTSFVHDSSFFVRFFSTKVFKQRALMWNYHCITWSSKHTFLPRMQSSPPRRMYKYDQRCLRKCRLWEDQRTVRCILVLSDLFYWCSFSVGTCTTMTRQNPSREGPVFFYTSSKVSHFFRDDDTYSLGFRKITMMNLWLLMFPLEKSMAGDFLRMLDLIFLRGSFAPYPSLGKLGNSSELKSFKLGMGYVIVLRRLSNQLEDLLQINKCLIFSGGLAESLVEALTGAPFIASRGSLLVPRMFILKDQFWWPDSRTKNRDLHSFFSSWGENTQCTYTPEI